MPSANKTPNYGLNQWQGNEYPKRQDFVDDNGILDTALAPTADPEQVPTGNGPGKLVQWVSWFANRIRAITGKSNWWEAPVKSIQEIWDALTSHEAEDATTSQKGHVQLSTSTSSTSTTLAATPSAVKAAYDLANGAIPKSLATAANDFLVASGAGAWVKKTLAEVRTLLSCLLTTGGTMSGAINMADQQFIRPEIKDYAETIGTTPATTGTCNFNLTTGNVFAVTPTGNITIGLINPPASGRAGSATIWLTNGATVYSKTFAASIKWVDDEIPDMSEANKTYCIVLTTLNGGTTYRAACIGTYSA